MADDKQPFSRLRSWLAPTRKTPATRSNQLAASSTPTTTPPNTSSPAARQARPSDKTRTTPNQSTSTSRKPASTGAQRTSSRPPGRTTQTSNPQPQASKTGSRLQSQARTTAQSPVGQKASQSSVATQSQTNPQPSATSISLATAQSQADPQPSTTSPTVGQQTSPSAATTQSQAYPKPSPPVGQQTSPSAATTQSQANPQPSTTSPPVGQQTSPSAATTQSQANLQSSTTSPCAATTQSQANPHPSTTSPSAATTQPQANPQSSTTSPSAATTQSQANPQPSTTSPPVDQQTSPSVATTESQANPQHSTTSPPVGRQTSPSAATTQAQAHPHPSTISGGVPHPEVVKYHSTRKKTSQAVTHDSSQLPPTSMEAPTSAFHKEEPLLASNSHNQGPGETNIQHNEKTTQSKEPSLVTARMSTREGGPETTIPAQRSKFSNMNNQKDPNAESYLKPEVTKEVAEIVQETKKDLEEPRQEVNAVQSFGSGTTEQIKEQQSDAVQSEQMLMDRQGDIGIKKMVAMSTRNGKQNKATTPQSRNTNVIGDSHQPPATFRGEDIPFHKEIKDNISKSLRRKTSGDARFPTDERPVSVITLAGENRGASMQLGSESSNKGRTLHIHRGYKLNPDGNTKATTDGETSSKQTESKDQKTIEEDQAAETCINSNVQGINNSILFNGSITERNPGVHLVQIRTSTKSIKPSDRKEALETHKAEFNMTPAQKLTYEQPTVRRRCLRGLFLESSDSDPENPEKPRRHGCRVGCIEKYQSNSVDIL